MAEESSRIDQDVISKVIERTQNLYSAIRDAPTDESRSWFKNLLWGILHCALLDYRSVQVGVKESICLAAWGCRNLLELKVITRYVLASAENAVDFKNDFVADAKEFYEALSTYHRAAHRKLLSMLEQAGLEQDELAPLFKKAHEIQMEQGTPAEGTDAEANAYRKVMLEFGLKADRKPKRASIIAKLVHDSEAFDPMFKLCSKIMHRTALSIASATIEGSLDALGPLLADTGLTNLVEIYDSVNKQFSQYGFHSRPAS
jgi:hypothetical protein